MQEPRVQEVKVGDCYDFDIAKRTMLSPNTQNIENFDFKGDTSEVEEVSQE